MRATILGHATALAAPLLLGIALMPPVARGAQTLADCAAIEDPDARLRCYDNLARPLPPAPAPVADIPVIELPSEEGYLTEVWNLGAAEKRIGITNIRPHRPSYLLLWRWSNGANQTPTSPAPNNSVTTPLDLDNNELKYQISAKAELIPRDTFESLGLNHIRLWFAYTQQSHWQVYSKSSSRPFRETNYEPELILTYGFDNRERGLKLVNLGVAHQSNGRSAPESRSWNRLYLQGGWEWGQYTLLARAWMNADTEDNPDIGEYIGRADAVMRWDSADRTQMISVLLRSNLRGGDSRGFAQIDWRPLRLSRDVGLHLQASTGYGESLIDYNYKQTTFGIGVSIVDWR